MSSGKWWPSCKQNFTGPSNPTKGCRGLVAGQVGQEGQAEDVQLRLEAGNVQEHSLTITLLESLGGNNG